MASRMLPLVGLLAMCSSSSASSPSKLTFGTLNVRYAPGQDVLSPSRNLSSLAPAPTASTSPSSPIWGERPWSERLPLLVDQIVVSSPDVIGFQEVLHHQLVDLVSLLSPAYDHVGVGRDDGKEAGEAVPVFWKRDRLRLEQVRHFWLSKTPDVPGSKDWDAVSCVHCSRTLLASDGPAQGQTRMVTMAKLAPVSSSSSPPPQRPKYYDPDLGPDLIFPPPHLPSSPSISEDAFYVLNTHWDDRGLQSRSEAAKLILSRAASLLSSSPRPSGGDPLVVLLGDLNSPAEEEGYRILTGGKYVDRSSAVATPTSLSPPTSRPLSGSGSGSSSNTDVTFLDSRHELLTRSRPLEGRGDGEEGKLRLSGPFGERDTFTGFDPSDRPQIIDFIMLAARSPSLSDDHRSKLDGGGKKTGHGGREWQVTRYGVVPNRFEHGFFVSDHRLVLATLER